MAVFTWQTTFRHFQINEIGTFRHFQINEIGTFRHNQINETEITYSHVDTFHSNFVGLFSPVETSPVLTYMPVGELGKFTFVSLVKW